MVTASVQSTQITASVSDNKINATVSAGIGPQGPTGLSTLAGAQDVQITSLTEGDVLRYSNSRWRNYREENLVDGGNW